MNIPSTDVIHSIRLSGSFFLRTDVVNYIQAYSDADVKELAWKVLELPAHSFEGSNLVKKEDVEEIVKYTPKFFRQMECEVVTILFTRFGQTD